VNVARQLYLPWLIASGSTKEQGVAYARTDIGGIYKLNADDTWTPLTDWVENANWGDWGVDALALDPSDAKQLYLATGEIKWLINYRFLIVIGMYTNSWDPNNGRIYKSVDGGSTWTYSQLPFKVNVITVPSACVY
jgi:xyloglucan-specific exo-beta-1,4-glucanase